MHEMRTMHLFAGAGGGLLADLILGHKPVVAIEQDGYCCQILRERVADGYFPDMQVWEGDIRLFDPSEWVGRISCINAGFPCQDISLAGGQAGIGEDTRSGLYREILRIADVVRPEFLFLENVAAITSNGLDQVLADLAERGFDAVWECLSAAEVGAPHKRDRWWCLAYPNSDACNAQLTESERQQRQTRVADGCQIMADTNGERKQQQEGSEQEQRRRPGYCREDVSNSNKLNDDGGRYGTSEICGERSEATGISESEQDVANARCEYGIGRRFVCGKKKKTGACNRPTRPGKHAKRVAIPGSVTEETISGWWAVEPDVGRVAHGVANRVPMLRALGNGQVPLQAAVAFSMLWEMMEAQA